MATLPILQYGQPNTEVLHQPAKILTKEEILSVPIQQLIADMKETMYHAPGVGLAAPQIGQKYQIIIIEDKGEYHQSISQAVLQERDRKPVPLHIIINPQLTVIDADEALFFEACLSVCTICRITPRKKSVRVTGLNEQAQPIEVVATGWFARILQHEVDHLHGKLYIDFAPQETEASMEEYKSRWLFANAQEIKAYYEASTQ